MTTRRIILGAVASAIMSLAAPAQAARMATLVRGIGAGSDKAAAITGHYVRELLSKDERYEVIDLNKALGNQDRDRALRAFQNAEEMVQKGRDAYDALELDAAVEFLTNALGKYERYAAYVGDFKKVAEALMLLGATHVLRGEEKLGSKRLEQAINVYPQAEPDPRVFNPAMRTLFTETVNRVNGRAPGTLSVTSSPGYAEVYVDGRFAGVTPLAVEHVSEGRHYVRLERDGYRAWGKVVDVTGRSETAEAALLKVTSHYDDFDTLMEAAIKRMTPPGKVGSGAASNDSIDKLGVLTGADNILLAQVRLDGERVQVWANQYDLNAQRLIKGGDHVFTYESRLDVYEHEIAVMLHTAFGTAVPDALLQGREVKRSDRVARDRDRDRDGRSGRDSDAEPALAESGGLPYATQGRCVFGWPCRTFKIAAVAVGGGVGAVSLGVGILHWFWAKQDHDTWRTLPQVSGRSALLAAEGRAYALRGDIFFGAGVALVAVGSAIYLFYDPSPSVGEVIGEGGGRAQLLVTPTNGGGMVGTRLTF